MKSLGGGSSRDEIGHAALEAEHSEKDELNRLEEGILITSVDAMLYKVLPPLAALPPYVEESRIVPVAGQRWTFLSGIFTYIFLLLLLNTALLH